MNIKKLLSNKLTVILSIAVFAVLGASCSQTADHSSMNHNASNSNAMSHSGMNHNSAAVNSNNSDHSTMDHSNMDHSMMKSSPDAANAPYDLQFIDTMIAHHAGAVDMAKMIAGKTQNAEMKKFGEQIVADQEKEINQMKDWREKWFTGKPGALNMEMPGMKDSMNMDMAKLSAAKDRDFDLAFIEMMIPHHDGAVAMAKEALEKSEREEIKTLAGQIIKAQEAEIKMMKDWQTKWAKN